MSSVTIYLNFMGNAEEAFNRYKQIFGAEFVAPFARMGDMPGMSGLSDSDKSKIMHVALPILGGTQLMGTDMLESFGQELKLGNNITISLMLDSKDEADHLYRELSEGGSKSEPMRDEFWGYWGMCRDRFGIPWMLNVSKPQ